MKLRIMNEPAEQRMDRPVIDNPVIPLPTSAAMAYAGLGMVGVRRRRNASPNEV